MEALNHSQKFLWSALILFIACYTIVFFPFAYFRHDDWLNLGNAVLRLPNDWSLLFSTSWIEKGVESVWFFRPFFKLSYFIGFKAFGFSYYAWLLSMLVLTLVALWNGYRTILSITGSASSASFFVIFFSGNLHFHLGSLLWAGEGFMNVPSVVLLSMSANFFTRYLKKQRQLRWQLLSLFSFLMALGYKESSFAHILFLSGIYFSINKKWNWCPAPLIPHAILTACYLVFRLFYLPINVMYLPQFGGSIASLTYFLIAFGTPVAGVFFFFGKKWNYLSRPTDIASICFILFFLAVILPHQGHPFFSPGWLMYPGFFMSFFLALSIRKDPPFKLRVGPWLVIFVLSFAGVIFKMKSLDWWRWGSAQREMHAVLESISSEKMQVVRIRDCENIELNPMRVLGYPGAVSDWYEAIHGKSLDFAYVPCKRPLTVDEKTLWYDWKFPHLTRAVE